MNNLYKLIFTCIAGVAMLIILGLAGKADVIEKQAQMEHYCEMVHAGAWPDYNENYDKACQAESPAALATQLTADQP